MQSPKYIIKNKYQEKNVERNMEFHLKNLSQINTKQTALQVQKNDEITKIEQRYKSKQLNSKFMLSEIERERNYENKSLLDRMINIQSGMNITTGGMRKNQSLISLKGSFSGLVPQSFAPKSLIAVTQKLEDERIQSENFKLVQRLNKLPPVISSVDFENSYVKHKDELRIAQRFRKLNPLTAVPKPQSKFNVYTDTLNELTNNMFENSKSMIQFPLIEEKIYRNTLLCIFYIQSVKVFNEYDLTNIKVPPKFSWEIKFKGKSRSRTLPKPFAKACDDITDCIIKKNATDVVELILWKIKNNDEQYIGQIEFEPDDFDDAEIIQEYNTKIIRERVMDKELHKKITNVNAFLGTVQIKMIQFCHKNIPSNKHSNIPGSPRDPHTRRQYERIEESKTDNYEWSYVSTSEEDHMIHQIEEFTIAISQSNSDPQLVLSEIQNRQELPHRRVQVKEYRKVIEAIDKNASIADQHKKYIKAQKITKQMIEDACIAGSFNYNQLFLQKCDELGQSLISLMIHDNQYPSCIEILTKINLLKQPDMVLEHIGNELFRNWGFHLRKSKMLKGVAAFIEALESIPTIGLVLNNYAIRQENIKMGKANSFLGNFNFSLYDHVIILGLIVKLCKKFISPQNEWLQSMNYAYNKEKKNVYFKVPVLPKKGNLIAKGDLLILEILNVNILHEMVRRKKWSSLNAVINKNLDAKILMNSTDCTNRTPLINALEAGPNDIVQQLISEDPCLLPNGRNVFHEVVKNRELSQSQLLEVLKKLQVLLGEKLTAKLLTTPWSLGHTVKGEYLDSPDLLPLTVYLYKLQIKTRKNKKIVKDISIITDIVRFLSAPFTKDSNDEKIIYSQQAQVIRTFVRFDDQFFDSMISKFDWVNYFNTSLFSQNYNYTPIIVLLLRSKKFNKFLNLVDNLAEEEQIQQRVVLGLLTSIKEIIESTDKEIQLNKSNLLGALQNKLKQSLSRNQTILFTQTDGYGLCNLKIQREFVIHQVYSLKQENLLPIKISSQLYTQLSDSQIVEILMQTLKFFNSNFGDSEIFKTLLQQLQNKQLLYDSLKTVLQNTKAINQIKYSDFSQLAQGVQNFLNEKDFELFGYRLLIENRQLFKDLLSKVYDENNSEKTLKDIIEKNLEVPFRCYRMKDIKYFISLLKTELLLDHLDAIYKVYKQLNWEISASIRKFCEIVLIECFSQVPSQKGLQAGYPLQYFFSFMFSHMELLTRSNLRRFFDQFLKQKNIPGLHYLLLFTSSNDLQGDSKWSNTLIQYQDAEMLPYFFSTRYEMKQQRYHWSVQLPLTKFVNMLTDVKELIQESHIQTTLQLLAEHGQADKMKLILDKVQDTSILLKCFKTSAIRAQNTFFNECKLSIPLKERKSYIQYEKQKCPYYERLRMNGLSKWSSIHGVNILMNQIYKQAQPFPNRLKNYVFYQGMIEKQLYKLEYAQNLRKSFLTSNFRSIFSGPIQEIQNDQLLVFTLIIDELTNRSAIFSNHTEDQIINILREITRQGCVATNLDKLHDLLQPSQPCTGFIVLNILRGAIDFFQKKSKNSEKVFLNVTGFLKRSLTSKIYQGLHHKLNEFPDIIDRLQRPFHVTEEKNIKFYSSWAVKFSTEVILIIEQNFLPQEMSNLKCISDGQHLLNFFACLILNSKNTDKRVVSFLQKHLQRKTFYRYFDGNKFIEGVNTFKLHPASSEFVIQMAKAGVMCVLDTNKFQPKGRRDMFTDMFEGVQLSALEYLIACGCDYLLNAYFLGLLKPKGTLSEDDRSRLIVSALFSNNLNCLQIVFDDIIGLKGADLKRTILDYHVMMSIAKTGNQAVMLWILRKKLRTIENFTIDEIYRLMSLRMNKEVQDPQSNDDKDELPKLPSLRNINSMKSSKFKKHVDPDQYLPLLVIVAQKQMSPFYKEFFIDFLLKVVCKNQLSEYKKLMLDILMYPRDKWPIALQQNETPMTLLEYCLSLQFYDVIQSVLSLDLKIAEHPNYNSEIHQKILNEQQSWSNKFSLLSPQMIDNLLRQDHFQQMNILQATLKIYKIIKTQTNVGRLVGNLGIIENKLVMAAYYRILGLKIEVPQTDPLAIVIIRLINGQYTFNTLEDILSYPEIWKNPLIVLYLLSIYGLDKQLNYNLTIDKFAEKHTLIKSSKLYTQLWKNKEILEQLGILMNENLSEGFKNRILNLPTNKNIFDFVRNFSITSKGDQIKQQNQDHSQKRLLTAYITEYFTINDPNLIILDELNFVHDQRLMFVTIRSAAEKSQPEMIMATLDSLIKAAKFMSSQCDNKTTNQCEGILRNILNGLVAVLMINPQRMANKILQKLHEIPTIAQHLNEELQPFTQILVAILISYSPSQNSLVHYSSNLRFVLDAMTRSIGYTMMCEVKPIGDLGVNITDEKIFTEGLKTSIEYFLRIRCTTSGIKGVKAFLPADILNKIVSMSAKPTLSVHNDKFFRGFTSIKTLIDIAWNIQILSEELLQTPHQRIGELEFRVEILPSEQAQKQSIMLLQQGLNQDARYKFLFKLPIGLQKNEVSSTISLFPSPIITQFQIDQAKITLSQVYLEKFLRLEWNDLIKSKYQDQIKISWETINPENMGIFYQNIYNIFPQQQDESDQPYKYLYELDHDFITNGFIFINTNGKDQELPFSNYSIRQRRTTTKVKMESDLTFPEFFKSLTYQMKPNYQFMILSEIEFSKRLRPITYLNFLLNELYNYNALISEICRLKRDKVSDEFISQVPLFNSQAQLPAWVDQSQKLQYAKELDPPQIIWVLQEKFAQYENLISNIPLKISIISFIDSLVMRLATILEKSLKSNKSLDFMRILDLAFQWNMIRTSIQMINDILISNSMEIFKGIYLEMNEVEPKKCYDSKTLTTQLEGLDQIFRMAPATFFVHSGILIIRLNFATIRTDLDPIDKLVNKNAKLRNQQSSIHLFQENIEIKNYLNSIVSRDSIIKQIIAQKKN